MGGKVSPCSEGVSKSVTFRFGGYTRLIIETQVRESIRYV
eukprot:COSAG02_NODE_123_length_35269_cov_51.697526_25_plen_40_part_00